MGANVLQVGLNLAKGTTGGLLGVGEGGGAIAELLPPREQMQRKNAAEDRRWGFE